MLSKDTTWCGFAYKTSVFQMPFLDLVRRVILSWAHMICLTHVGGPSTRRRPSILSKVDISEHLDRPFAIASLIDHTLLKPEASKNDIGRICEEARQFAFASVCINPCWVRCAAEALSGSPVKVCTVIGFPLGANKKDTKVSEAKLALEHGAGELDMVQNVGALRSGDHALVKSEIVEIAALARAHGVLLKVILETCLLTDEEKQAACRLAMEARADFVKTSTGFSTGGATVEDVALMRRTVGSALGVKASGGVRTLASLREMVRAGANRIGTSSGVHILAEVGGGTGAPTQTSAKSLAESY